METGRMVCGGITFLFAAAALIISYFQFKEKGYLFNNAYFWASPEERRKMDDDPESKKPHYRQSGFAFLLIGICFLVFAAYMMTGWRWLSAAFWMAVICAVVYAAASSVQSERRERRKQ